MKMLSAVVPPEHVRALDRIAKRRGLTRSDIVRAAIEHYLRPDASIEAVREAAATDRVRARWRVDKAPRALARALAASGDVS